MIDMSGMVDIAVSYYQLIYCSRKVFHPKTNGRKQIKIRLRKNFTTDVFHRHLVNASFPNDEVFTDVNAAYLDLLII